MTLECLGLGDGQVAGGESWCIDPVAGSVLWMWPLVVTELRDLLKPHSWVELPRQVQSRCNSALLCREVKLNQKKSGWEVPHFMAWQWPPCYLECSAAASPSASVRTFRNAEVEDWQERAGDTQWSSGKGGSPETDYDDDQTSYDIGPRDWVFWTGNRFPCPWKVYQEGAVPVQSEVNNVAPVVLPDRRGFDTLAAQQGLCPSWNRLTPPLPVSHSGL